MINPINHTRTPADVEYISEPYVMASDVYHGEGQGRAGWTWYTGTAGWMYQAAIGTFWGCTSSAGVVHNPCVPRRFGPVYRIPKARRDVYHFRTSSGIGEAWLCYEGGS